MPLHVYTAGHLHVHVNCTRMKFNAPKRPWLMLDIIQM